MTIPPVVRTIDVPWDRDAAFRRFTRELGSWWPLKTHSVSEGRATTAVFEERVGGTIHEVMPDGTRHVWGTVLAWSPPDSARFTWHPGEPADTAQEVELRFEDLPGGTSRLTLTHTGWEKLGAKGRRMSKAYRLGWAYVLSLYAGRKGLLVHTMNVLTPVIRFVARRRLGK